MTARRWYVERPRDDFDDVGALSMTLEPSVWRAPVRGQRLGRGTDLRPRLVDHGARRGRRVTAHLSDADRESLGCRCQRVQGERRHHIADCPVPAVEAIVARAIARALTEAADAIVHERMNRCGHVPWERGMADAAAIVRARIPN